jgi:hypothetical protein
MPPVPVDLSTLAFLGGHSTASPEYSAIFIALGLALAAMRARGRRRGRGPYGGNGGGGHHGGGGSGGPSGDPPTQWDIRKSEAPAEDVPTSEHNPPSDL